MIACSGAARVVQVHAEFGSHARRIRANRAISCWVVVVACADGQIFDPQGQMIDQVVPPSPR